MKSYKKILILLILFVTVAGMTMSGVSATQKTINFKKEGMMSNIKLGHGDQCIAGYGKNYQMTGGDYKSVSICIASKYGDGWVGSYYKATKAKVYYKKTTTGKMMTKTYKFYYSKWGNFISEKLPAGYKPTKTVLYYQKK